jgi:methylated-DNA-[protein]-cysteine S-methyltransferase
MRTHIHSFKSPIGTIHTAATDRALVGIGLPGETATAFRARIDKLFPGNTDRTAGSVNRRAERQILKYLAGRLSRFDLPLDLSVAPYYRRVLGKVSRIPYGQTKTYGEIAGSLGNAKAARAVGTANASNPLPLVIPCHRVVAANGLGGYGGGLKLKQRLLEIERSAAARR